MRIRLCSTSFHLMAATTLSALLVLCLPHLLWAYGRGDGGDGGDGTSGQTSTIQPLNRQQIENIFGRVGKGPGLSPEIVEKVVGIFKGKKVDPKELYRLRQRILEIEQKNEQFWASVKGGAVVLVETVDTVGAWTQFALTFVPGVGWATNAGLSLARSGADEFKKGGDAGQIAKAMTVDGVTSVVMRGSSLGSKGSSYLGRSARTLKASTQQASKTVQKMLIKRSKSHLIKGVAYSGVNTALGKGAKAVVGGTTTMIQNNLPSPTYSSSRSGGWGPHFAR